MVPGLAGVGHLEHRLVAVAVELLALGLDALDVVALERRLSWRSVAGDPLDQIAQRLVLGQRLLRHGGQRAREIVGHRQDLLGERGRRIARGILAVALQATARVLDLGQRPQELVLQAGGLGACLFQLGDEIQFAGCCLLHSLVRHAFTVRSGWIPVDIPEVFVSWPRSFGRSIPGGVVHHGYDPGVVNARRADNAHRANDALVAIAIGRYQREQPERPKSSLSAPI